MENLFCLNCLSNVGKDVILMRCAKEVCKYHSRPIEYGELLQLAKSRAQELFLQNRKNKIKRFFFLQSEPLQLGPMIESLETCSHIKWRLTDYTNINKVCLFCVRCPEDGSYFDLCCPVCGVNLSLGLFFNNPQKIIPIFGGPFSGKTVLIRSIIHDLTSIFDQNDKFFGIFNEEGREYVYNGYHLTGNIEILPQRNLWRSPPIILQSENDYRILYDVPGNWLSEAQKLEENVHLFLQSPVIIVILDPYSIPGLKRYLENIPENSARDAIHLTAEDVVLNLIETYERLGMINHEGRIPASLYIVLSKTDVLKNLKQYYPGEETGESGGKSRGLKELSEKLVSFPNPGADRSQLAETMESWLAKVGLTSLFLNARQHFAEVRYFSISVLGRSPMIIEDQRRSEDRISAFALNGHQPAGTIPLSKAIFNLE